MRTIPRRLTSVVALGVALALVGATPSANASTMTGASAGSTAPAKQVAKPKVVYDQIALPHGRTAKVFSNGLAILSDPRTGNRANRMLPAYDTKQTPTGRELDVGKAQVIADLLRGKPTAYRPDRVQVVLAHDVRATRPVTTVSNSRLTATGRMRGAELVKAAPAYTSSAALNTRLADLGARRMARLVRDLPARAAKAATSAPLDLTNAYVIDLAGQNAATAVESLLASPDVAYVSPAWTVSPMNVRPTVIPKDKVEAARQAARQMRRAAAPDAEAPALPTNYALTASMQSLLNKPGINWTEAYRVLQQRYGQLPGEGEIITNVSVADLTDATLPVGPTCEGSLRRNGPTTVVQDGQRYLDLPSLPLIPTYVASLDGTLDPTGATCNQDPFDGEVDLDFAMMAALPHDQQRPGATGSGYTDLLGVAPGADYRLVVPATSSGTVDVTDVDAALLAAAQQTPHPDIITASLGFGFDTQGFPSRYLEDDQLTQALVSFIVDYYGVVVCIASNDGLRSFTLAAYGPSGGSAPTNIARRGTRPTDLADLWMSDAPSRVRDSGAIAVGGTTLDDIFSAPPQDPGSGALAHQHAFPIVRFNGTLTFSSGFGSRVNVSAPGDNMIAFQHRLGGQPRDVDSVIGAGTSASAPIVAAAAAVVQQTAELVGADDLASNPRRIRSWLTSTGEPVPNVPRADRPIHVGPQVNVGEAVARLVRTRTGDGLAPGVARVAVEQRRPYSSDNSVFVGDTDPAAISLTGDSQLAWITIAPDWLGSAARGGTRYELRVGDTVLASTPYARVSPEQLFAAAGRDWLPSESTTIEATYTAHAAGGVRVSTSITLGFRPASGSVTPLAPEVPPMVTGGFIPVTYDLSGFTNIDAPVLVVSEPGRTDLGDGWRIRYQQVLSRLSGTVRVPVSALEGGGIYGIKIQAGLQLDAFTNSAFTRVVNARSDVRPPAPSLSSAGSQPGHLLEIPYGGNVTVHWDVRDVPHARGARLEVSAPGPVLFYLNRNTFNNPNGTVRDANGIDSGSVSDLRLRGTHGVITLSADELGLAAGTYQQLRVRPVDRKGRVAGEESGYSTIHRFGVTGPAGNVANFWPGMGFGVDKHGPAGIVASLGAPFAQGVAGAITQFDQRTNTPTRTLAVATFGHFLAPVNGGSPGVFADHMALYQDLDLLNGSEVFHAVDLTTGEQRDWVPPEGYLPPQGLGLSAQLMAADNQASPDTAFVVGTSGEGDDWKVFTTDIAAGTFGPAYSLADAVAGLERPTLVGVAQDPATHTAYVVASAPPSSAIIAVDLTDGSTRTIQLPADLAVPQGIAVLSGAGKALVGGLLAMCLVDLESGQAKVVGPSIAGTWVAADNSRGEFLVTQGAPPVAPDPHAPGNIWGALAYDYNVMSDVLVLDPQGRLLRTVASLSLVGYYRGGGRYVQLNPSTGTGYGIAPDGYSLQPFSYAD